MESGDVVLLVLLCGLSVCVCVCVCVCVQGQELTVRQMALVAFRDLVLLKLHLEETLGAAASVPPPVTQMLLVLQVNTPTCSSSS